MATYSIEQGDINLWLDSYDVEKLGRFHCLIADPPYALLENSKRFSSPTAKPAKGASFARVGKGFMGQTWDGFRDLLHYQQWVTEWASKLHRVMYPGAVVALYGGSRTFHRLAVGLEDAGLEISDVLMWVYGSGMPKSLNIGKAMKKKAHKAGQVSTRFEYWEGMGTQLKPAYEPIIIARIPRGKLGYVDLAEAYQTGALNIDAARIETDDTYHRNEMNDIRGGKYGAALGKSIPADKNMHSAGRFPSNVVFSHRESCSDSQCAPGCPVGQLDEQSGVTSNHSPSDHERVVSGSRSMAFGFKAGFMAQTYHDEGGASRFFYTGKAATWERHLPDYLQPSEALKPAARLRLLEQLHEIEPQFGTNDIFPARWVLRSLRYKMQPARATHPTVKPLDITTYIGKLLLPPPGGSEPRRLLVPFSGVGSEMIGAHLAGWDIIQGVELTPEYIPQALSRLGWWTRYATYESAQAAYNDRKKAGRKVTDSRTAEEKAGVRRVPLFPDDEG